MRQVTPTSPDKTEVSMAASIRLRTGQYRKFAAVKGWRTQAEAATAIGFSEPALSRIVRGIRGPGAEFIAACLNAFPELEFADLFEVTTDDSEEAEHAAPEAIRGTHEVVARSRQSVDPSTASVPA